jgi:hypothetical protein
MLEWGWLYPSIVRPRREGMEFKPALQTALVAAGKKPGSDESALE